MIMTNAKIALTIKECSFLSEFAGCNMDCIKALNTWDAINDYVHNLLLQYQCPETAEEKLMKQLLINFNIELHEQVSNSLMNKDNLFAYCKNNVFDRQPFSETIYKNIEKVEWQSMSTLPFSKGKLCSPGRTWVLGIKEITPHIGTLLKNLPKQMQMISVTLKNVSGVDELKFELIINSVEDEYVHLHSTPWQLLENNVIHFFQNKKGSDKKQLYCHINGEFWSDV